MQLISDMWLKLARLKAAGLLVIRTGGLNRAVRLT
nr:MAG TPA: hypothetical protein [Caudoviricetes sp.]